jgi:hypothetical protein
LVTLVGLISPVIALGASGDETLVLSLEVSSLIFVCVLNTHCLQLQTLQSHLKSMLQSISSGSALSYMFEQLPHLYCCGEGLKAETALSELSLLA